MKKRVLLATGQKLIDEAVSRFENYEVLERVEYKEFVAEQMAVYNPDILLIGEGLSGQESTIEIIMRMIKDYPKARIIYLAGYVDVRDEAKMNSLGILVMAGVYDISHEETLTSPALKNIFEHPRTYEQMSYLVKKVGSKKKKMVNFEIPDDEVRTDSDIYKNLFVVSSIKPGTGKSFLSSNIAAAIAAYGTNVNGRKPKVALIEGDLQNLSIGTLLQIEDDKKNIKTAMDKISTVLSEKGEMVGNIQETEDVERFVLSCFKPYSRLKNLEALVGSNLTLSQLENIKPYHYVYLIESILKEFDVIIVDTNSSLTHVTTYPLLHMAKACYYVINLDFNNIRNNSRYQDVLQEIEVLDKVKYVLNEDFTQDESYKSSENPEELIFTADHLDDSSFKLEGRIPTITKSVFLNRLFEGIPIVLDDNKYTLKARYELMKVANQIHPIKNFDKLEQEVLRYEKSKKRKGFFSSN